MAPSGTVRSSGPRLKPEYCLARPRISSAADMFFPFGDQRTQEGDDLGIGEAGFAGFAEGFDEERAGAFFLRVAAFHVGGVGDEGAQALPAVDDPFALELFVGAFDGDDADE